MSTNDTIRSLVGNQRLLTRKSNAHKLQDGWTSWMTSDNEMADVDLATAVALLDDKHVRSILVATSETPLSANELSEQCELSTSSIYRRLDRLTAADLVSEQTRPRSDGHHETVYVSRLDRFELTIRDGELNWGIDRDSDDVSDQLTRLWAKF